MTAPKARKASKKIAPGITGGKDPLIDSYVRAQAKREARTAKAVEFPPVALLGKQVEVLLHEPERVIARGKLLSFCDSGEAVLLGEDGFVHWCWPMLEIKEDVRADD